MMKFNTAYERKKILDFLQNEFLPENDFTRDESKMDIQHKTKYIKAITKLGTCPSLKLAVYEANHTSTNDARVGLSKEIFRFMANKRERKALVLFVPVDNNANYRFSLISIELNETETGSVKRTYSNPRRYSYYLGKGISYYTPNKYLNEAGRVKDAKDLTERFSVEVLTKAFYQELSDWYAWAVKVVRFPNKLDDPNDDAMFNAESTIRLVTRLIFVWFLKQKRLVPKEFFDERYIADNLLKDFAPNLQTGLFKQKSLESKYYKAILQNLFFAMLNSPITQEGKSELSERHFHSNSSDANNSKLMCYESMFKNPQLFVDLANKTVPFLNGGLFDCLDDKENGNYIDGFSDRKDVQNSLIVPDFLFFGEEVGKNIDLSEWYGDKKKKKVSARGIIDILKRYNFTVEENTPFDQDVSLDPELLGKVFENLLASYNPETQTTARKQTGSFYTPREIVQYMVDESLVTHLKRTVGEELEQEYRKLLQYTDDEISLTDEQKDRIMQSLYECKILDPACGSGAFPVGILQQMVHILSRIDPDNERWREMILDEAANESRSAFQAETREEREERLKDIERSFDEKLNNPDYARKLYLIENCIYGVDIQPIAIQISKLRFFISLVVDQRTDTDPVANFGIRPLPNLEAKFVAANTLIPLAKTDGNLGRTPEITAIEERLKEANHKIFNAKTVKTKRKWKERLKELRSELIQQLSDNRFLTDEAVNQVASWDMFDQNASASFFDADWMFGIKDGFDIIIGNPPYQRIQGIRETNSAFADELIKLYKSAVGSFDLYVTFVERGLQIIHQRGLVNYIMPVKWTNAAFGKGLRSIVSESNAAHKIINFGAYQVFNASTYTGLQWFKPNSSKLMYYELNKDLSTNQELSYYLKDLTNADASIIFAEKLGQSQWVLTNGITAQILNKLEKHHRCIRDVFDKIFQGIATSKDDVYFLYNCEVSADCVVGESKQIGRTVKIERSLVRPLLKGEDVHRYDNIHTNKYVIFPYEIIGGKVLLYSEAKLASTFPLGYSYLKECEGVLRARENGRFNIDGEWFQFGRKQGVAFAEQIKLVAPDISMGGNFAYDKNGEFYSTTTIYGYIKKKSIKENYKFWLALLNSRLCWWFMENTGTIMANGFFRYKPDYINPFPVPNNIAPSIERAITTLVDYIITIKAIPKSSILWDNIDYDVIVRQLEKIIDALIYELYFPAEFEDADITFAGPVNRDFLPLDTNDIDQSIKSIITSFKKLRDINNEIRNNLKYMSIKLDYLLSPIINA